MTLKGKFIIVVSVLVVAFIAIVWTYLYNGLSGREDEPREVPLRNDVSGEFEATTSLSTDLPPL